MAKPKLFSYFRSSCAWRVRIALAWKGIDYEYIPVNLIKNGGEQFNSQYRDVNPMQQVPAFVDENGNTISQSVAILEFLEETYPNKKTLLPREPVSRAQVRMLVETIVSGIQPLQNLTVIRKHSTDTDEQMAWAAHWVASGFVGLEKMLQQTAGKYSVGDEITLADACLVPQVANAERFKVDMGPYPTIKRINDALKQLDAFKTAAPENQPDFPKEKETVKY